MPWGRVDDQFYDHPKVEPLRQDLEGLAALGLWALALSYCNKYLTDGSLTRSRPGRLAEGIEADVVARMTERLVAAGLWERTPEGFNVHDFLEFNDSRADVLARREANAERMRNARAGARSTARSDARSTARSDARTAHVQPHLAGAGARPHPVPSRPVPSVGTPAGAGDAGARAREVGTTNGTAGDPWATFGPEWSTFRAAWEARGLRLPPAGEPGDDPDAEHPSQRTILWGIVDAAPEAAAQWVREAPGKRAIEVVGHVIAQWHARRAAVEVLEAVRAEEGPSRAEAAAMVAELVAEEGEG